jgi:hypothetical protein
MKAIYICALLHLFRSKNSMAYFSILRFFEKGVPIPRLTLGLQLKEDLICCNLLKSLKWSSTLLSPPAQFRREYSKKCEILAVFPPPFGIFANVVARNGTPNWQPQNYWLEAAFRGWVVFEDAWCGSTQVCTLIYLYKRG